MCPLNVVIECIIGEVVGFTSALSTKLLTCKVIQSASELKMRVFDHECCDAFQPINLLFQVFSLHLNCDLRSNWLFLLFCCFVVLLFCCFVVLLFCCFVVLLFCCFVVLLFCCFVVLLFCCFVVLLFCCFVVLLFCCFVVLLFCCFVTNTH